MGVYLWTPGYVSRVRTYPGFETPKPVLIDTNRGDGDILTVMRDVLALTKVNYNSCDFVGGLPVTLKFADRVGEVLTASPKG
jgi:argonaute-like protein implicated in RNA metabolism and viral defense